MVLKFFAAGVFLVGVAIAAGVSGATFYFWPTFLADEAVVVSPKTIEALASLRAERKFLVDQSSFYFGAPNEAIRSSAQRSVDDLLDVLLVELPKHPQRSMVLAKFKDAMASFSLAESEEKDQFLVYLQRIMKVLGMPGSGELLNVWRYGFPYGWFI
ncbi:MAG: DUF4844 domain-containing protein [Burkholderiaceae bacterium]|nr:DUF4844 domain-containing protein [Burkholderiaceae bacterium]